MDRLEKLLGYLTVIRPVLTQFLIALAIVAIAIWLAVSWHFDWIERGLKSTLESKDATIGTLHERINFQTEQLAAFRQVPASTVTAGKENASSAGTLTTNLELKFPAEISKQSVSLVSASNIWRWNYLTTGIVMIKDSAPNFVNFGIFVVFDKPITFKTVSVSSDNNQLPAWSLADSSDRTAMIIFSGGLNGKTVAFRFNP